MSIRRASSVHRACSRFSRCRDTGQIAPNTRAVSSVSTTFGVAARRANPRKTGQNTPPVGIFIVQYQLLRLTGAVKKTRTSTAFRPQRPQRCASTSSAMTARSGVRSVSPVRQERAVSRERQSAQCRIGSSNSGAGPALTAWRRGSRPDAWGHRRECCRRRARSIRPAGHWP
jgi:hypothetical protein